MQISRIFQTDNFKILNVHRFKMSITYRHTVIEKVPRDTDSRTETQYQKTQRSSEPGRPFWVVPSWGEKAGSAYRPHEPSAEKSPEKDVWSLARCLPSAEAIPNWGPPSSSTASVWGRNPSVLRGTLSSTSQYPLHTFSQVGQGSQLNARQRRGNLWDRAPGQAGRTRILT